MWPVLAAGAQGGCAVDQRHVCASAPASHEPLATPTVDVHSGLRMAAALDVLRHLWFRGPDSFAPAHAAVRRPLTRSRTPSSTFRNTYRPPSSKLSFMQRLRAGACARLEARCPATRPSANSATVTRDLRVQEASAERSSTRFALIATDGSGHRTCRDWKDSSRCRPRLVTVC